MGIAKVLEAVIFPKFLFFQIFQELCKTEFAQGEMATECYWITAPVWPEQSWAGVQANELPLISHMGAGTQGFERFSAAFLWTLVSSWI